jgi:predicted N-acetyltransferase YhbS
MTVRTVERHAPASLLHQISASNHLFLVAHRGETLVGHACATRHSKELLYLGRLYVLPTEQRCGIGHRLLAAILDRSLGARRVTGRGRKHESPQLLSTRGFHRRRGGAGGRLALDPH